MKKITKMLSALLLSGAMLLVTGCGQAEKPQDTGGIKVVTVNFPPYDFVKQITDGEIIPEMLLKGGQDAHTFEPTAKDIIKINEADIFIYTGGESDEWVDTIAESIDSNVRIIKMMDCIGDGLIEEDSDEHEDHYHSQETGYDEHIWTSPKNAIAISKGITDALCEIAPENAQKYRDGLAAYTAELETLSDELQAAADALDKPLIFGDRFPFKYMAHDYGIEYLAAFSGCSTDTEPSAAKMTELIEKAGQTGAKVIFHIEFSTGKVADAVAEAVGAQTRLMHSCHTLSDSDISAGETYVSVMRKNIEAMRGI
ncbi:MAG: zinc ABC transporter substrate-binding protein [Ruminiclostridium sp.]|nr:zinc ABC transporter substrate-binding protein [Ruminiclostridium sp.]